MVSYEQYKENEQNRVKEKYAMVPDLDKRTIGDFLIEFDNLKIKEPTLEQEEEAKEYTYEETMTELEENFEQRSNEEKKILTFYHSFIRKSLINTHSISKKEVEDFINTIENPNNILIKLKYFKNIDTSDVDKCIESIRKEAEQIKTIKEDCLKGNINVFFKENKVITTQNFLAASTKRILSPSQNNLENDINYIALLKKDTPVYFAPIELTFDLENDDMLIQKENQPFLLIDVQKSSIQNTNSDIIKAYTKGTSLKIYEIDGNWGRTNEGWVCLVYTDYKKSDTSSSSSNSNKASKYSTGRYEVNTDVLTVRRTPEVKENNWLRYSQLTTNAQKQVKQKCGYEANGLVKGVQCDVSQVSGNWGKIPSRLDLLGLLQENIIKKFKKERKKIWLLIK